MVSLHDSVREEVCLCGTFACGEENAGIITVKSQQKKKVTA